MGSWDVPHHGALRERRKKEEWGGRTKEERKNKRSEKGRKFTYITTF